MVEKQLYPYYISKARNVSTKSFDLVQHVSPKGGPGVYIIRTKQKLYIVT